MSWFSLAASSPKQETGLWEMGTDQGFWASALEQLGKMKGQGEVKILSELLSHLIPISVLWM